VRGRSVSELDVARESDQVDRTLKRVKLHGEDLLLRLEKYREYLENTRQSQTKGGSKGMQNANSSKGKNPKKADGKPKVAKMSHDKLVKSGVIHESRVPELGRKKATIQFTVNQAGEVDVTAFFQGVAVDSYQFSLDGLLERQYANEKLLHLEFVTLNLNMLIHLVKTQLLAK